MSCETAYNSGCLLCGADLVYSRDHTRFVCALCAEEYASNAQCANGHYICDSCHGLPALDLIERTCAASSESEPLRLAMALMDNHAMKMHGPEHHFLVPAVLITAYSTVHGSGDKISKLATARKRAEDVKGGFCGFHGTCGAAMGAGIACSVLTGATPLAAEEWRLANLTTAACLTAIGEAGGPRCCKRDTFLALIAGRDFLNKHIDAGLPVADAPICHHSAKNKECIRGRCQFYRHV